MGQPAGQVAIFHGGVGQPVGQVQGFAGVCRGWCVGAGFAGGVGQPAGQVAIFHGERSSPMYGRLRDREMFPIPILSNYIFFVLVSYLLL